MAHIFTVAELTRAIRNTLEAELPFVWVRGQISDLAAPPSGHLYFSLGDGDAVLPIVWFHRRRKQSAECEVDPLTGEVGTGKLLEPVEGMEVLVAGRVTAYSSRGVYQLQAELVQEEGVGQRRLAFEAMRNELVGLGYFDADRKMTLPKFPQRVGLVTSPHGAAVRDFLRIAGDRGCGCEIRIYPTLVQGESAPASISGALEIAMDEGWAEVLVLARGGGSSEDLAAFNTRTVADALFLSTVPVVSGVGHEIDTTIADLVADVRAATPSHAAQLLWPDREELLQRLDDAEGALFAAWYRILQRHEERLGVLEQGLTWLSPGARIRQLLESFEEQSLRLDQAARRYVAQRTAGFERVQESLLRAGKEFLATRGRVLERLETAHEALDPELPLRRGYSLVRVERTGRFLRSPDDVRPEDMLDIRVRDGDVRALVTRKETT